MTVTAAATEVEGSTVTSCSVITSRTAVICACCHYARSHEAGEAPGVLSSRRLPVRLGSATGGVSRRAKAAPSRWGRRATTLTFLVFWLPAGAIARAPPQLD